MTINSLTEIETENQGQRTTSPFDAIRGYRADGSEYWTGRELTKWLEYKDWRNGEKAIKRAIVSCNNNHQNPKLHIVEVNKVVHRAGSGSIEINDYELSRFGCYLVAQNADPEKEMVAQAQGYFATQTHKAETTQSFDPSSLSRRDILKMAIESEDARILAEAKLSLAQLQIQIEQPMVDFGRAILKSSENIRVGDFAKILGDIGRNDYFAELRDCGIILKNSTLPAQRFINEGYMMATEVVYNKKIYPVALITPKGQKYLTTRHRKHVAMSLVERQMELELEDALV
jgi:phage antirepressor YoqD-like protein